MNKTEKKFDSVAMMRSARDKISVAIEGMTLEEELQWLAAQELHDPLLESLRYCAAHAPAEVTRERGREAARGTGSVGMDRGR